MNNNLVDLVTASVVNILKQTETEPKEQGIRVGVSARHVHLSQSDLETLFGKGYKLTPKKNAYGRPVCGGGMRNAG